MVKKKHVSVVLGSHPPSLASPMATKSVDHFDHLITGMKPWDPYVWGASAVISSHWLVGLYTLPSGFCYLECLGIMINVWYITPTFG